MTKIKVLGSSSAGNGYLIESDNSKLILELGCNWKKYLSAMNFELENCVGALVTHVHGDHINLATYKNFHKTGLRLYAPKSVCEKVEAVEIQHKAKYALGDFRIVPLLVKHGDCECYSYVIDNVTDGTRILFITDCQYFGYNVKGVNALLIEANNSTEMLLNAIADGFEVRSRSETHMEVQTTIDTIKRLQNENMSVLMLIHLSDNYSDEELFKKIVYKSTGIKPMVGHPGVEVEVFTDDF
jgi:phosphoribosyl 1,2-cyclic phosphodiesterase